jgi:transposase InsO family protein
MFHRKLILAGKEPKTEPERLIKAEFAENKGRYGVRRIAASLRGKGHPVNHKVVQRIMKKLGLKQSMSRKGNCHDNAVMENFFGRLKVEMFYGEEKTFRNYEDFRKALEEYMLWYNQERIKEYL